MLIEIIIGVIVVIATITGVFCMNKRMKIREKNLIDSICYGNNGKDVEDNFTVLMQDDDNTVLMQDDDDNTVLMQNVDELPGFVKTIRLQAENKMDKYEFKCVTDVTIGRKSYCDVQILDDKSVSGVHCVISCDNQGNLIIKDNNSSNGTYLNDEKLVEEKFIESGDTLEIGRTRYSVQIIGE